MARKTFTKLDVGERVEQSDLQHATLESQLRIMQSIGEDFLMGRSNDSNHPTGVVLEGFEVSEDGAENLTVQGGVALLGMRNNGTAQQGMILSSGDTSKTIDTSAFPDSTVYGVWVRFELRDEDFANRLFWDSVSSPAQEVVKNIATRKVENWTAVVEVAQPGPEWIKVGEANKTGGTITGNVSDERTFFFDTVTGQILDSDWGTVDDRVVSARDQGNGVFGLYKHSKATLRQLQDIIGGTAWVTDPSSGAVAGTGPRSLTQLNAEKLGLTGGQEMGQSIVPDTNNIYNLGSASNRWFAGHFGQLNSSIYNLNSTQNHDLLINGANCTFTKTSGIGGAGPWDISNSGTQDITGHDVDVFSGRARFTVECTAGSGGEVTANYAIHIPHGAVITDIIVYYNRDTNGVMTCDVFRALAGGGAAGASLRTAGTPFNLVSTGGVDSNVSISPDQFLTIDNDSYAYYLLVRMIDFSVGAPMYVNAIEIRYDIDSVPLH